MTISKGIRSKIVWELREELGKLLENNNYILQSKIWFNLSIQNRLKPSILDLIYTYKSNTNDKDKSNNTKSKSKSKRMSLKSYHSYGSVIEITTEQGIETIISPPKNKEIAISAIATFLEQYASEDTVLNANAIASNLCLNHNYLIIAKQFEAKYSRVPEGFIFYLLEAGLTGLEQIREEIEEQEDRDLEV